VASTPDELEVIDTIVRIAGSARRGYSRIGDDVAVLRGKEGRPVLKTDMLVEHTDVPPGMTYRQAARKVVAMCVSDFAAKGVRPDSFMVSLGLRKGISKLQVEELSLGFRDAGREWGVGLVGGDTNEAKELVIDCAMLGYAERVVTRKGASPGDLLVVTGAFGLTAAGLKILAAGAKGTQAFARAATMSVLEPTPDLELGVALGPFLTSSMDSSDGLARSIHTLARASGVGFELNRLPVATGVRGFAAFNGLDANRLVLEGGEEYVIVGTVRRRRLRAAQKAANGVGGTVTPIGTATSKPGKVVLNAEDGAHPIRDSGWTHLRGR
jgi:thiamine-monophosphate kinase